MADKHTSETYCLSLKEKGKRHAQRKRLYPDRAFDGDFHYRVVGGNSAAYIAACQETGKSGYLSIQPEAMGDYLYNVHGQQRWALPQTKVP